MVGSALLALVAAQYAAGSDWTLVWADEFDGSALNTSLWNVKNNRTHCCQLGKQELTLYLPDEVFVADGRLVIRTRRREVIGPQYGTGKPMVYNYTSGWLDTQGNAFHRFGKVEANISLPTRSAQGVWPAFWLMPESGCWPTGGEVDIFEFNGNGLEDRICGSYHWAAKGDCGKDREPLVGWCTRPEGSAQDWQTGWHIYGVEWDDAEMRWYLDGRKYLTRSASKVLFPTDSMHVIFDQAIDPILFPPTKRHPGAPYEGDGVRMQVEWVRWYQLNETV
eukprot:TRINITY_DN60303_c0_g1_i1.p1 TRINITY_DN60303_c0_g1~~TRINITY_DN60303_c0_g1_i1.p1  ORF type:complete len:278 (+),score=61.70 TRINITY_DN60303_c0_g1_i1:69-902(+)